eukprot:731874-Amphidinium_carterae.1
MLSVLIPTCVAATKKLIWQSSDALISGVISASVRLKQVFALRGMYLPCQVACTRSLSRCKAWQPLFCDASTTACMSEQGEPRVIQRSTQTTCHVVWGSVEPDSDESAERSLEEHGVDPALQARLQADAANVLFLEESPESSAGNESATENARDVSRRRWSYGSRLHSQGLCTPCVHFWKPKSCAQRQYCDFCHLCSHDNLTRFLAMRKKLDKGRRREARRQVRQRRHRKAESIEWADDSSADSERLEEVGTQSGGQCKGSSTQSRKGWNLVNLFVPSESLAC